MDHSTIANLFAHAGSDTRQWVSIGTVDVSTAEKPSVRFKDANGAPLQTGPLVDVTLQPSGIAVVCRVGNTCAGNGEGEWYPFVDKDEVLVVLPSGDESGYPVIVSRLNQGIDLFPELVAGQDTTENKFGFRRMRAPFVIETASAYLIRHATTGSQIGIDANGQVIINDAEKGRIFFSPDVIELSSGDSKTFLQLQVDKQTVAMRGGNATLALADNTTLTIPGQLSIGTGGVGATGHAVTAEQVALMFLNYTAVMVAQSAFMMPFAALWGADGSRLAILNALLSGLAAGATPAPVGPGPGGNVAAAAVGMTAFKAALATDALSPQDVTGLQPGIGRANILL
jgi:hypothetical protein